MKNRIDQFKCRFRGHELFLIVLVGMILLLSSCSDNSSGPGNSPPVIESIVCDPGSVHPGAEVILTAYTADPEGDSIKYRWLTYPNAGKFSDTLASLCTLTVNPILEGGMFLKVDLQVSDGNDAADTSIWIPLIEGETVSGHTYYANTEIPLPGAIVIIDRLIDTASFRGAYEIKHNPPGQRTITVSKDGCTEFSAQVVIDSHMTRDIYVECEGLSRYVSGTIAAYNGVGLENVLVTVLNDDGTPTVLNNVTDADGNFILAGVPPGKRLFSIEDVGNPDYQVMTDTLNITIVNDTAIQIPGRVKEVLFVSEGIDRPEDWILEDVDYWKGWLIDFENECYYFNSCELFGLGRLGMAHTVIVPPEAENLTWSIEADLYEATLMIGYVIDGESIYTENAAVGTGAFSMSGLVNIPDINPADHDFAVEFYSWSNNIDICCTICFHRFELSYYR